MTVQMIRGNSVDECFTIAVMAFMSGLKRLNSGEVTLSPEMEERQLFYLRRTEDATSPDKGQVMLEYSALLTIDNPRDRLVYSKSLDIFNLVGLWFYLLRGSRDLKDIEYYNPLARKFADEESSSSTLRGNWGERLFTSGGVTRAVNLLKANPNTRRAIISVFSLEDLGYESRNLPCLAAVQFAKKSAHHLEMFSTMRSQAAIGVLPYDLFLLTMLHEYVSMRTEMTIGQYHHYAPLFGIREHEFKQVGDIVKEGGKTIIRKGLEMEPMQLLEPGMKQLMLDAESRIKAHKDWQSAKDKLPPYWVSFLYVTEMRSMYRDKNDAWEMLLPNLEQAFPTAFIEKSAERLRALYKQ